MFGTGIPTKLRCIRYGIKKQGAYYIAKRPYGIVYHTKANEIVEVIHEENQYDALNVKGKKVVDIGADCGDTAIQFAYRGAREVYAYEPNLNAFKSLELTLLNNSYKQIKAYNMAVLGKAQTIGINPEAKANRGGKIAEGNYQIKATTLNDIVKEHNIIGALKMDCEGYEYGIIAGASDKTLSAFDNVVIEYHNYPQELPDRFRNLGYKVDVPNPKQRIALMWASW